MLRVFKGMSRPVPGDVLARRVLELSGLIRLIHCFSEKYADAALALANWMRAVRAAAWRTQAEVKAQFHDSDLVGDRTVFNIAHNRYRLVAYLSFRTQILYVKHILTRREYDKGNWKQ